METAAVGQVKEKRPKEGGVGWVVINSEKHLSIKIMAWPFSKSELSEL